MSGRSRWAAKEIRHELRGLLFVSPWLVGFLVWSIYPLLSSIYYSLTRYDIVRPPVFMGLDNYGYLFGGDNTFRLVLRNTLYYVGLSAPLGTISAFMLAALLNTRIVGRSVFRAIFFMPSIVPAAVTAMVWRFLLNAHFGLINSTLRSIGLRVIPFLSSPQLAVPSLILIHMWGQGSLMVIFLATLQDVPRSLLDAATVDGAGSWQKFRHVTIPLCSPVILFALVTGFIGGFQTFTLPWLLTGGGPNQATELYALYLYRNAFEFLAMGRACALAWILFVIVVGFTIVLFKATGRFVYYAGA